MGKMSDKFEEISGKAKQKLGEASGDERLEAEGDTERTKAKGKQAAQHMKDAAGKARDAMRND